MSLTPEGTVVKSIRTYLRKKNYLTINIISASPNGIPDMLVISDQGAHVYLEIKREIGGRVSPVQRLMHKKLRRHNCEVYVVETLAEVKEIL